MEYYVVRVELRKFLDKDLDVQLDTWESSEKNIFFLFLVFSFTFTWHRAHFAKITRITGRDIFHNSHVLTTRAEFRAVIIQLLLDAIRNVVVHTDVAKYSYFLSVRIFEIRCTPIKSMWNCSESSYCRKKWRNYTMSFERIWWIVFAKLLILIIFFMCSAASHIIMFPPPIGKFILSVFGQ